jgi:hypothetical protein
MLARGSTSLNACSRTRPVATTTCFKRDKRRVAPADDVHLQPQQGVCLVQAGPFLQLEDGRALLSRVISPVFGQRAREAGSSSTQQAPPPCCGYTLISVKQQRQNRTQREDGGFGTPYRVVGVQTCGRGVPKHGQRCKCHQGAAQFEVWRVREVEADGQEVRRGNNPSPDRLQQAMLLSSCHSSTQLERFFGLHLSQRRLQVCVSVWGGGEKGCTCTCAPHMPHSSNSEQFLERSLNGVADIQCDRVQDAYVLLLSCSWSTTGALWAVCWRTSSSVLACKYSQVQTKSCLHGKGGEENGGISQHKP